MSVNDRSKFYHRYWDKEEHRETRTAWYFVENAALRFRKAHQTVRAAKQLPSTIAILEDGNFAEFGHWIESGSGIVAARREFLKERKSLGIGHTGTKLLTIILPPAVLPDGKLAVRGQFKFGGSGRDDPMIFWSSWGHRRFTCYAYATGGTMKYRRLPAPARIGSKLLPKYRGDPYMQTLAVDLDVQFGRVYEDLAETVTSKEDRLCPPFSVRESLEFYWRPVEAVVSDYQYDSK